MDTDTGDGVFQETITIETRKLGEVVVREMFIEDIQAIAGEIGKVAASIPPDLLKEDTAINAAVSHILANKEIVPALKRIAGQLTDREHTEFDRMSITDWMKLTKAFLQVNDVSELRNLFLAIRGMFKNVIPTKPIQETEGE